MLDTSSDDFPITNERYWTEFTIFLTLLISRTGRGLCPELPICPLLPQNCSLIVDVKDRYTSLLNKGNVLKPVDNVPVDDICLLLHGEHCYALTSLSAWFGRSYYCMECENHTTTRISTSVNQNTLVACIRKRLSCTSHPKKNSNNSNNNNYSNNKSNNYSNMSNNSH